MSNFESFSEDLVPRITPQPALIPSLDISKPIVPEVSIIFDDSKPNISTESKQPKSYKEWKQHQQILSTTACNKENMTVEKKKNVKFDFSVDTQNKTIPSNGNGLMGDIAMTPCRQLELSLCEQMGATSLPANVNAAILQSKHQQLNGQSEVYQESSQNSQLAQKAFGSETVLLKKNEPSLNELYQLLSTQPKPLQTQNVAKEITLDDIYQLLIKTQQKQPKQHQTTTEPMPEWNTRTDLMNHNPQHILYSQNQAEVNHAFPVHTTQLQTGDTNMNVMRSSDVEPTIKDLFNVIVKQQEQLLNIQKQVHAILMNNAVPVAAPRQVFDKHLNEPIHQLNIPAYNRFSAPPNPVGVMTSLEINVQQYTHNKPAHIQTNETDNYAQRIARNKQVFDENKENAECCCDCKKSKKTIYLTNSDNYNENATNLLKSDENRAGWTFYGNILDQVNNVLQNSPPAGPVKHMRQQQQQQQQQTAELNSPDSNQTINNDQSDAHSLATYRNNIDSPNIQLAQIKQIGFQFDDVNISAMSKRVTFDSATENGQKRLHVTDKLASSERSVLMNALAMKYLPIENQQSDLCLPNSMRNRGTNFAATATTATTKATISTMNTTPNRQNACDNNFNVNNSPSDMSLASYRYMEKYGLL